MSTSRGVCLRSASTSRKGATGHGLRRHEKAEGIMMGQLLVVQRADTALPTKDG